jgi:NitT/TauT family transport system substrate-binding protein
MSGGKMRTVWTAALLAVFATAGTLGPLGRAKAADVVVTEYKADPCGAPFAIALAKGYFKDANTGITGVVSGPGGGTTLRDLMASDLGYGSVAPAAAIAAILHGQDIKIVNLGTLSLADMYILVMPPSPAKSLKDLVGKKWGYSHPKSLTEMVAVMAMQKVGVKLDDAHRLALGSLGGALTALEHGLVDVVPVAMQLYEIKGAGKYRVLARGSDLPPMPVCIGVATTAMMQNHADQLRAILAARRKAVQYLYAHPDEAAELLSKVYAPMTPAEVKAMIEELVKEKFWGEGDIRLEPLKNTLEVMKYVGLVKGDVDLGKMIDTSFLPKDLQAIRQ